MLRWKTNRQISESMPLAIFLTLAGGFQDAYSYNCRGKVFVNAQTGNIALLGQNLAQGNFQAALRYLIPVAVFIGGVYITQWIHHVWKEHQKIHWRQIILMVEIILLFLVGLLPHTMDMLANAMMSFACAMQVTSFRKFRGLPSATTMCIGNMRDATEMLCQYHITKKKTLKQKSIYYYIMIFVFAVGAAVGAMMSIYIDLYAIWIAGGLLFVGFMLMFIKEDQRE